MDTKNYEFFKNKVLHYLPSSSYPFYQSLFEVFYLNLTTLLIHLFFKFKFIKKLKILEFFECFE